MKKRTVLAIDIGGSKLFVGIVDETGQILAERKMQFQSVSRQIILDSIRQLCMPLAEMFAPDRIGVSIPGLADPKTGVWKEAVFSKVRDFPIAENLAALFALPVFIDNDANNCACAEKIFGCAKTVDDFIWLTISNGCGAGIFLNGQLFSGASGNAGELGHVCVTDEDFLCPCGNRGCLESVAAGPGIVRRYEAAVTARKPSLSAKTIAHMAEAGDAAARAVYEKTGVYIGKAIAAAVNILNVPLVVLGGGIGMDSSLYIAALKKTVDEHLYATANKNLTIVSTALGYNASLLGAAATAFIRGSKIPFK